MDASESEEDVEIEARGDSECRGCVVATGFVCIVMGRMNALL